jgi:hypothetical protein
VLGPDHPDWVRTNRRSGPSVSRIVNVPVTSNVRRGIGWGFGWCAALDIEELGIKVAPTIKVPDQRLQG